jgi:hypothetical protein
VNAGVDQLIETAEIKELERSEVVFIDIGAILGTFTIAAAAAGFKVYAFEPMETFEPLDTVYVQIRSILLTTSPSSRRGWETFLQLVD